ncbi:MAG: hypothetical protein AAF599_19850, partial [Bacteroidota bacterium]
MTSILNEVGQSKSFRTKLEASYSDLELTDLRIRKSRLQLSSGDWVSYKSYYVRQMGSKQKLASRHLSHLHWSCEKGASMSYMSVVSAFSVVSISFEVGKNLLDLAGIKANKSRMRALIKCLSKNSLEQGDTILLDQSDQLSGKRVVIGFDGGRSRMRENNGKRSKKGNACYETPWREPKVIVIRVLNEQGQLERKKSLPIFLATMQSTQRAMKRLGKLLQALGIHQAEHIQFISDGARTIWTNIMKVLRELKVNFSKVTLTLDYYHAREHLSDLVRYLPDQTQQNVVLEQYKDWLWKARLLSSNKIKELIHIGTKFNLAIGDRERPFGSMNIDCNRRKNSTIDR